MTYFAHCATLDELRAEYRRLIKLHHPDVGGDPETMKTINNEYDVAFDALKRGTASAAETPAAYRAAVENILHCDGLNIELCGSWLWVTGNTYVYRETLKAAGYRFAAKKRAWYWHPEDAYTTGRGKKTLEQIRMCYGSQAVSGCAASRAAITA